METVKFTVDGNDYEMEYNTDNIYKMTYITVWSEVDGVLKDLIAIVTIDNGVENASVTYKVDESNYTDGDYPYFEFNFNDPLATARWAVSTHPSN